MICPEFHTAAQRLLPQRAVYLQEYRALLIADAHFGKAAAFRRQGVPVPRGTTAANLAVIDALLQSTGAQHIVFLGDLFHSSVALGSRVAVQWRDWRRAHAAIDVTLVEGNHDAKAFKQAPLPADFGIALHSEPFALGPFALCHHPQHVPGRYVLCGHVHPGFRLQGRAADSVRLPCFWFGAQCGVLPAFGEFTGSHVVQPSPGDRVYVIAGDAVLPVPGY
ncbi:MAG: ligase-associated DNA damage response endonuclease PdeM [Betaproteobacteria bacterium]|nr:ligase-associated DNA damage response endonuclease PdeM [Betaproteobacteria bacterium]